MKRTDFEEIKLMFESSGYKLISTIYKDNKGKLETICPNGHKYMATKSTFKKGVRCGICSNDNKKFSHEYVRKIIEKDGYQQLSIYVNTRTIMLLICPNGHQWKAKMRSFILGHRCPKCSNVSKRTLEELKSIVVGSGYKYLENEVKTNDQKMTIECSSGHIYKVHVCSFVAGHRCRACSGLKKKTIEEVKSLFEKEGYTILDNQYVNAETKLRTLCPKNHEYSANLHSFSKGKRCPRCKIYKNEINCRKIFFDLFEKEFIKSKPDFLLSPITGFKLELDGYNKELKLAFEYDGEHHYDESIWRKIIQSSKKKRCLERRIV